MWTVTNVNLDAPGRKILSLSLAHCQGVFVGCLYLFSVSVIVRLMKCTGYVPLTVVWSRAADESSSKLASVRRIAGLLEPKNAIVFSLEMLYLLPLLLVYPCEISGFFN